MNYRWLLLALLAASVPAAAREMYSWTDANGVKHFSDSPPADISKARKLKVAGGVTTEAAEAQPKAANAESGPALAAAAGYSPEDIKRNCQTARGNLATLETQKPANDAEGNPVDAEAAARHQTQVDRANQQIKLFCDTH
ncbi:DUF4124 domain-containing protein [Dokdonella sp.]|uniref:DUF4124 domain-containing protein n=1 Tax=Dokdonella sp. TaxID=2291710 RepID=UPI00262419BC|nr:DUF4124 domain-containing protein [Dokdonella sp.]